MKLTLSITLDNAAFTQNEGQEAGWILQRLGAFLDTEMVTLTPGDAGQLRDHNGNLVGTWQVEE